MLVNAQADAQYGPCTPKVALKQRYGKPEISTGHQHLNPLPGKSRGNSGAVVWYPVRKAIAPRLVSHEDAPLLVMYSINKPEDESLRVG